jgi:hypothetical protein
MPPPPARIVRKNLRFRPETIAVVRAIADARGGLTETRVFELAVEELGRRILGRRLADLIPPRARPGRGMPG